MDIRKIRGARYTPQGQKIKGREAEMASNYAGGIAFKSDPAVQFYRLLLSVPQNTYYRKEEDIWRDLRALVQHFLKENPDVIFKLIELVRPIAFRPHSILATYAFVFHYADSPQIKARARESFVRNVRTLNYLQEFMRIWKVIHEPRKSNTTIRKLIHQWILARIEEKRLEYQAVKFYVRQNWSIYDLLRIAHPRLRDAVISDVVEYHRNGYKGEFRTRLFKLRQKLQNASPDEAARIIEKERLFREIVPDSLRNNPTVAAALARTAPALSFVKSLPELASLGVLNAGNKSFIEFAIDRINGAAQKLHPFDLAVMSFIYASGQTRRRNFQPVKAITDALNAATIAAFKRYKTDQNNPFKGKRTFIAVDTSGSMWSGRTSSGLLPIQAATVFAKLIGDMADDYVTGTFADEFEPYNYDYTDNLNGISEQFEKHSACCGTDASSAVLYLLRKKIQVDIIVMITDGQSWKGYQLPEVIDDYRRFAGKNVPLILINTLPSYQETQLIDPKDPYSFRLEGDSADIAKFIEFAVSGKLDPNWILNALA